MSAVEVRANEVGVDDSSSQAVRVSRRESLWMGLIATGGVLVPGVLAGCGDNGTGSVPGGASTGAVGMLKPFDPNAPAGSAPDLPSVIGVPGGFDNPEAIAFVKQIELGGKAHGLSLQSAVANGDATKEADQTNQMLVRGIGAMVQYPLNEAATRSLSQRALDMGVCVIGVTRPYTTVQFNVDQHATGLAEARAAVKWIKQNADGRAKVVFFDNSKTDPSSGPRTEAVIAELKKGGPGIELIKVDDRGSVEQDANAFSAILQAHPDINVVIASPLSGNAAFSVFDAKGRGNDPDVCIVVESGGDDMLARVASGTSIVKTVLGFPWPVLGYAAGFYAGEWLEGKSIPRLIGAPGGAPVEISTAEGVTQWQEDMENAGDAWENRRETYVDLWGNISYDERQNYWREIVSSPAKAQA